jgi:hypothetical protein
MGFSTFTGDGARYDAGRNQYVANTGGPTHGYGANGAITITAGVHRITKTSAAAMTLAPPTAGDDGMVIDVEAGTAFAHTLTVTGGLGGNAGDDVVTFAKVGDGIRLRASNLFWVPVGSPYGAVIS